MKLMMSITVLLAFAVSSIPAPALAAGGPGDGTSSSSWLADKRILRSLAAISSEDYSGAVEILTTLVTDKPDFADAWNYLGFSLRKTGKFKRSEKAYHTALRLNPKHRGAHEYLGELYLQTGRRKEAEALERSLTSICQFGCPELEELRAALKAQ